MCSSQIAVGAVQFRGLTSFYPLSSDISFQLCFLTGCIAKESDKVLLVPQGCTITDECLKSVETNCRSAFVVSTRDLPCLSSGRMDKAYQLVYVQDDVVIGTSISFTFTDRHRGNVTTSCTCVGDSTLSVTTSSLSTSTSLLLDARRQLDHKQKAKVVENDMKQERGNKRIHTAAEEAIPSRSKEMPMPTQSLHSRLHTCHTRGRSPVELNDDEVSKRIDSFAVVELPSCDIFLESEMLQQEAITKIVVEKSRLAKLCETERAVAVRQRSKNEEIEKANDIKLNENRRLRREIHETDYQIQVIKKKLNAMKHGVCVTRDSSDIGINLFDFGAEATHSGGNIKSFSHHTSLSDIFSCPICFITFDKTKADHFQRHVQSHFIGQDDD
ncbi:uncharacterized protein LOC134195066 [Corticium candelabrum]|uniref:uncharacterized protein LOC134195066 n=1 Tax=Corticium candelabrum TaxID=121492 RepID=UPI002E271929|nr:uncharacterized protein LOC134195066 [Corticium candelabrum]